MQTAKIARVAVPAWQLNTRHANGSFESGVILRQIEKLTFAVTMA